MAIAVEEGLVIQMRLKDLKLLDLTVALDDFGTGYSSLATLHQLSIDVVKIDRSFVSLAESSAHHRVLIEAVVKVARSLGMETVAEGIGTEIQASIVANLQCDKGQGYYCAKPMTGELAKRWLMEHALVLGDECSLSPCQALGVDNFA